MVMVKWIGDAQQAVDDEDLDTEDGLPQVCVSKWKPVTLAVLFAGQKKKACACVNSEFGPVGDWLNGGNCGNGQG
jgi:hypothetical protein